MRNDNHQKNFRINFTLRKKNGCNYFIDASKVP